MGGKTRSIKAIERALSVCSGRQVAAVKVRRHQVGVGVDPGLTHRLQLVEAVPRHLELEQRFPPAREPSGVGVSDRNLAAPGVYADGEADELRRVEAIAAVKKLVVRIRRLAARFGAGVIAFDQSTTGNLNPFFSMSSPNSRSSSSLFIGKQVRRRAHLLYLDRASFSVSPPRPPRHASAGWATRSLRTVGGTVISCPECEARPTPSAGGRLPPPSLPSEGGRMGGGWPLTLGKTDSARAADDLRGIRSSLSHGHSYIRFAPSPLEGVFPESRSGAGSFSARRPSRYLPVEITRLQRGNAVNIGGEIQCPTIPAMPRVCDPRRRGRVATRSERPMRSRARLMKLSAFSHPGGALRVPVRRAA